MLEVNTRAARAAARAAGGDTVWLQVLALATLLLTGSALAKSGEVFRFAWLSDTHVGSQTAAEDLKATVRDINSQTGLSFVVISGDITEYGSMEQFQATREILRELRIPCHLIPGNHDTKWSESGATDFARVWKSDRFVFEHGGYLFIGLHQGPLMKMGDGHWAPQDVRWLEELLRKTRPGQPIIFVTHYPLDSGIANWYVVLGLLKQRNVQAILCGHGHSNRKLSFEGIPGVMGRSNVRARHPAGGYNLVEVAGGELRFAEKRPEQEVQPPWHSLTLEQRDYRNQTNQHPRPDFSVNQQFPDVRRRWSECTGYTIASTPALWQEMAIVGDASGAVYSFDVRTGEKQWTYRTKSAVYSTPAVAGDLVIVPSTDGTIYALKAKTGKPAWRYKTGRPIVASPAVAGELVYIGSSEGKMRALRADSGKLAWEYGEVRGFIETRPLVYEGKIYFGAWDQQFYALDAASGQMAWKWKGDRPGTLLSPAACWPVAAAGQVYIVAPDRQMTAIEAGSGRQIWRTGKYQVRESIGISEDASRVYVRTMNDHFHAFATGKAEPEQVWERNAGFGYDINSGMLVEAEGVVFYGTKNGLLIALNGATGEILWQHKLGTGVMNTVLPVSKRFVLVTDFDGNIALIEDSRVGSTR